MANGSNIIVFFVFVAWIRLNRCSVELLDTEPLGLPPGSAPAVVWLIAPNCLVLLLGWKCCGVAATFCCYCAERSYCGPCPLVEDIRFLARSGVFSMLVTATGYCWQLIYRSKSLAFIFFWISD